MVQIKIAQSLLKSSKDILYPVVPLRDIVVFPNIPTNLFVGRDKSVNALTKIINEDDDRVVLVTQKSSECEDPTTKDLYRVGVIAKVLQVVKLSDGNYKAVVEGYDRVRVDKYSVGKSMIKAKVSTIDNFADLEKPEVKKLARVLLATFADYTKKQTQREFPDTINRLNQMEDIDKCVDIIISHVSLKIEHKQQALECETLAAKIEQTIVLIEEEMAVIDVEKKLRRRVKTQLEKNQRDYYLSEQMKAIQKEMGDKDFKGELDEYDIRLENSGMTAEAKEKAKAELKKLKVMNPSSAESTVSRNYLDWLLDVPWQQKKKINSDDKIAEDALNKGHYGLDKVKERVLEYIAVFKRVKKNNGSILCLIGPPGVGKTSLAKSIAQATGREYTRISLGGVRDESEIRGHRRTYIGSMPGKIIQSMKKCGTVNPLILLDEIDKMGRDFRGDPASALLEVLDPEQNQAFNDHYMEVDYDISNVLFLCTANSYDIPEPLLDRMEIIDLSGYTEDEKVAIANNHIINRQLANHGLLPEHISSLNDDILRFIIQRYTREAGVRGLERQIGKVFRKIARHLNINAEKKSQEVDVAPTIDEDLVRQYLGVPKYKYRTVEKQNPPGVVSGLAWNSVGGDTLSIEAAAVYGKAGFKTTGNLKDVMRESIQAAYTFVRSQAPEFGIHPNIFDRRELHVHVPEGATPKDGPSAGIAMCTAIVSLLTGIPARSDLAMTGEITLTGRVLAIGGLKEKLLAAMRSGIKTVLIPKDNEKDLAEIPDNVKADLEIITVEKASDVLKHALTKKLIAIDWVEPPLDGVNIFASDDNSDNDMARYGTT